MDGHGENEVKNHSERETEENSNGDNSEVVSELPSDHEEKQSNSGKVAEESSAEEAATHEPETNSENKLCTDFDVMNKVKEEVDSTYHETPDLESSRPVQQEEEEADEEGTIAACAHKVSIKYTECRQLLLDLRKERDTAKYNSSQLQMKLAQYLKKTGDRAQMESEKLVTGQLQEYERCINTLTDLKQQLSADSEAAQHQAEDLRLQCQEKLEKVENEWQTLMALKRDTALKVLSGSLGKEVAQAKVEAFLQAEQLRQDKLIKLRIKHIKLKMKVCRLEAELRHGEERSGDALQMQFERLQAEKLEQKKQAEKQNKESLKLQKKICSSLEILSNIKEKVDWNQMEIKAEREQLIELETMLARKRDLLTRIKQEKSRLLRHNLRLKECRGLLGNRVLLQDFEETVDASDHLEEQLENLKCQHAEILLSSGRWKKKLEGI
ncbi:cilia- and flagella-associated protein 184 [Archocentrus centrarchus]|uniref:cilia- and flagella-associated protein 184 n=1 Tax=Archocentrus centrarchus TaxID=63155 RepID=UPI0011EA0D88|nr:coiled-coil domain-containing protein 96 [Archocentrus centrarchus]